jgi:hypothetical protein
MKTFVCKVCNNRLKKEFFVINKTLSNGIELNCKKCRNEYQKKYRKSNPDKFKKTKEFFLERRKTKSFKLQRKRKRQKDRDNLSRSYIVIQLYNKGFKISSIDNEMIECQRIILKTKRLCKTLENSEKN